MPPILLREPLWRGPEQDGITFSLLSRFLSCRERFRLLVVEGLAPNDSFNHRIEFGSMFHVCAESLAAASSLEKSLWLTSLRDYCKGLCSRYPTEQNQIDKWYNVCKLLFPLYVRYWHKNPDVLHRQPLMQEVAFAVPYTLPSGRKVLLRGKWDSVDVIGKGKGAAIYLQENKTKGDIKEQQLKRQLTFDLQTMIYMIALDEATKLYKQYKENHFGDISTTVLKQFTKYPLAGIRYNVIRRPLSGGKGTIIQKKPSKSGMGETLEEYYKRVASYIEAEPETYFMRWKVEIRKEDIETFKRECLNPILEQLCDWWEWVMDVSPTNNERWGSHKHGPFQSWVPAPNKLHYRHPFGVFNPLDEGGCTDLDEYLATGSTVGLTQVSTLFPELDSPEPKESA